ncbi:MAG: ribulose 1,5-bisphosphate carboxylase [Acidobacteria bacterium]|nr:ribulose 1,5-bisphosphate carboxylase [Acidobacteriota bacterium]NIM62171.1 ribulose 1,5-bisphosphate carboxylase [Acidobacteriota bacterium]NIO58965.1 ribulose 1,5-bisphosphate carboxylase [Acidobacteriota bacterium]NIQ30011.1 ribulose 1,5-bisphosphate carboxylase [Acidobacteriota bacterium]NIQ84777.1 ribulose 1,5-bisphosphate carboxylase [Acidobacteriota bacterium]
MGAGFSADDRLRVTYRLLCVEGETPRDKAEDIAYEQTVELPPSCVGEAITEAVVGRIESVEPGPARSWTAVISYSPEWIGDDAAQLANVMFGNISLKQGIVITDVEWPTTLLERFGGPAHGVRGLRKMAGVEPERPLLCAALKPVGLSAEELAELCYRFADGGIDLIKDDHGLTDQPSAPFDERVRRCREAVAKANDSTGGNTLYFPNVTGPASRLMDRVETARGAGCRGVLVSPLLAGLDSLQRLAREDDLAVLAHPALSGAFFGASHGILPEILLGDLFRILGADGVIYPNVGGRFPFDDRICRAINDRLRRDLGKILPAFPVPGGGIDVKIVPHWIAQYGADTMLLIGGSLYGQDDLTSATRRLVDQIKLATS